MRYMHNTVFLCVFLYWNPGLAECRLLSAAELPQQLKVGEQVLTLNGAGSRSKAFMEMYQSGLYLVSPSRDSAAIVSADQFMAIRIRITSSFVSRSTLVAALNEGLEKSTQGNTQQIKEEVRRFLDCLAEEVSKNDILDFVYVPAKGLAVLKNGKLKGMIAGLAFKKALFGIWLCDDPADPNLKQAMLRGNSIR